MNRKKPPEIEVFRTYDVNFGFQTGFTKQFKAKTTKDVLELAEGYMNSGDYLNQARKFENDPNFAKNMVYQIIRIDGDKRTIVYDYFNGIYDK